MQERMIRKAILEFMTIINCDNCPLTDECLAYNNPDLYGICDEVKIKMKRMKLERQ